MEGLATFAFGCTWGAFIVTLVKSRPKPSTGDRFLSETEAWVKKMRTMNRFSGSVVTGQAELVLPSAGRCKVTIEPLGQTEVDA